VWSSLPSSPGVYWFLDERDNVLYVGKAKNLKNRIASYKQWKATFGKTRRLVFHAQKLKFQVLESELEALLVEAELIRTHQPEYNILLKDDKTPLYIFITKEEYPRVLTIRKKEVEKGQLKGTVLGPFQSAYQVGQVLEIARKIFPYCLKLRNKDYGTPQNSPCFEYHLDLCPGSCVGDITKEKYQENIQQLVLFLKGQKKDVIREVQQEMKKAATEEDYEYAADLRDKVELITTFTEKSYKMKPDLHLPKLKESLRAEGLIYLRRILFTHFSLPKKYPLTTIEGYDVSNIQGTNATVALVTFTNGAADKSKYKLFNIRTLKTPNDYAMLQEALLRRQNHPEWGIPDLVVIDGGKGQLRAALKIWQWSMPVISIAKKPDRIIVPLLTKEEKKSKKNTSTTERTVVPLEDTRPNLEGLKYHELTLEPDHPALRLIQQIRDESHRFSKLQHTRLRGKSMFE
jgi:excinuclease ABC subunit C